MLPAEQDSKPTRVMQKSLQSTVLRHEQVAGDQCFGEQETQGIGAVEERRAPALEVVTVA